MHGWSGGWGMGFMGLFWILVIVLVVAAVWRLLPRGGASRSVPPAGDEAEELLRRRYAKGELDREEYQQKLEDLRR